MARAHLEFSLILPLLRGKANGLNFGPDGHWNGLRRAVVFA